MTTLTTQAGFDAFRERMCDHFANLPDRLAVKPLHVSQAELPAESYFTHRMDDDGHHIVYDPRQTTGLMVRQFLAIYADFTEGRILGRARDAYYEANCDGARRIWAIAISEMDRTQDPSGVMDQLCMVIEGSRSKRVGGAA
ncbi:hypothetical protein [Streptomyces antibioticus]|uniref:hypothetical protein n=1 Tax=Streptomyces antibioticus TaxID=1890 RepID=UPI003D73ACD2